MAAPPLRSIFSLERILCGIGKRVPVPAIQRLAWDREFNSGYWAERLHGYPKCLTLILENVPPGSSLIDLACGDGVMARHVFERGWTGKYIGFDLSDAALQQARELCPLADWRIGNITDPLPFTPDALLLIECIYYVSVEAARKTVEHANARFTLCRIWNRRKHAEHADMLLGLGFQEQPAGEIGAAFYRVR